MLDPSGGTDANDPAVAVVALAPAGVFDEEACLDAIDGSSSPIVRPSPRLLLAVNDRRLKLRRMKLREGEEFPARVDERASDVEDEGLEGQLTGSSSGIDCVVTAPWPRAAAGRSFAHVVSPPACSSLEVCFAASTCKASDL